MNTPAHLILNLTVLGKQDTEKYLLPVLLGALLPDLPMFVFYFVERVVLGTPNQLIWREAYFEPTWQNFIDSFNSIPIIALAFGYAWLAKNRFVMLLCLSMLLHIAFDLPVHHDDGHRHFFPLVQWRFESPVSYWDPRHYGRTVGLLEAGMVFACCVLMFRRHKIMWTRIAVLLVAFLQIVEMAPAMKFYI